jgi:hypothetical protein
MAKVIITNAIIGLIVVLVPHLIVGFVLARLGIDTRLPNTRNIF